MRGSRPGLPVAACRIAQAAIAWLLARSAVMLPIPGTASLEHLEENVAAATLQLTPADLAEIDGTGPA